MNTTTIRVRSLDQDRQHTVTTDAHLTVADRLSVRFGLWLLLRNARRIDRERQVDFRARSASSERARREHELNLARASQFGIRIY